MLKRVGGDYGGGGSAGLSKSVIVTNQVSNTDTPPQPARRRLKAKKENRRKNAFG
jgi:hypothetical protein